MPDLNDFYAFENTTSDDGNIGSGCSSPITVTAIILFCLWLIWKVFD